MAENSLTAIEIDFVREAAGYLENPSWLVRVTHWLGRPFEAGMERLPQRLKQSIGAVSREVLLKTIAGASKTIHYSNEETPLTIRVARACRSKRWHTAATVVTGGVGGFIGGPVALGEIALSSAIILRAIASVASEMGLDPADPWVRLQILTVFALGSPSKSDDALESAYFASRLGLAELIEKSALWLAGRSAEQVAQAVAEKSAPLLIQLLARISARFEVVLTEKLAAELTPGIGAAGGALLNGAFTTHFSNVARYHFGLLSLEGKYGREAVRGFYVENLG
jgi:hypothetical protein